MNKKEILKKVGGILTELNEQYQYLSQNPDNLNELELELFSANSNFLADHLSILVKLNDAKTEREVAKNIGTVNDQIHPNLKENGQTSVSIEEQSQNIKSEERTEPQWKFDSDAEPSLNFEHDAAEEKEVFERPLTEEEKQVIDNDTKLKTITTESEDEVGRKVNEELNDSANDQVAVKSEELVEEHVKEVVISERTLVIPTEPVAKENPIPTINDLLSKTVSQQTLSSQFNSRQSQDLKGMISLNDKLVFVRDLFNGYSLAYSEALELVNRFDNFEAADNFLKQNYAAKNNWAAKQDVADKFYEILSRRFAK